VDVTGVAAHKDISTNKTENHQAEYCNNFQNDLRNTVIENIDDNHPTYGEKAIILYERSKNNKKLISE